MNKRFLYDVFLVNFYPNLGLLLTPENHNLIKLEPTIYKIIHKDVYVKRLTFHFFYSLGLEMGLIGSDSF